MAASVRARGAGRALTHVVTVPYKPDQYATVTPYLVVADAQQLVDFITRVLDGVELLRLPGPDGRIGHAEMRVGDSVVMLADAPTQDAVTPAMLHVYVADADAMHARALEAGAVSTREPRTEFYGDRMAGVRDGNGLQWYFATHVEDVSDDEMQRRAAQLAAQES